MKHLSVFSLLAIVVIAVLAIIVVAVKGPQYDHPGRYAKSSILVAVDDADDEDTEEEEIDNEALTAKLLKYLNDAEKELGEFEKQVEGYAKSLKVCEKKKAGKTRNKCVDPVVKKMKVSQKNLCEYADVLPAECQLLEPSYKGSYTKDFFKHFTNKLADETRKSLAQKRAALTLDEEEGDGAADLDEEDIDESDYEPVSTKNPLKVK